MTAADNGTASATTFIGDGEEHGGGIFTSTFDQYVAAMFTADADALTRLLPSRDLHPLRWFNGRAVLMVDAYDRTLRIGDLPPVRHGAFYLLAWVTLGRSAAPPVLPLAGQMLPVIGDALGRRYGCGAFLLASIVTNRVAAEIGRVLLGEPAALGEVRMERRPGALRYTAIDPGGGILTLAVPVGGRTRPIDSGTNCVYSARGGDLLRQSLHNAMHQSMRLGRSSARLDLGQHPWAALARDLGMSMRPWGSVSWSGASETMEHLERIGAADRRSTAPEEPTEPDPAELPFVIREPDGSEEVVDQQLDRLPFSAAGRFEPA
jgi:hypothetical protein